MKAVLAKRAPRIPVVDLLHDAPAFGIEPAAHLLPALAARFPRGTVFLAVVDPGVGGTRDAIVVEVDARSFVGPDNGLFSVLWQRAARRRCRRIAWRPQRLSTSFHGRDLFAPIAAALARRQVPRRWLVAKAAPEVMLDPDDLARVIYIDHYGNALTGLRPGKTGRALRAGKRLLAHARSFEAATGAFWYENSLGLAEIAVPQGSAARKLKLKVGSRVEWIASPSGDTRQKARA